MDEERTQKHCHSSLVRIFPPHWNHGWPEQGAEVTTLSSGSKAGILETRRPHSHHLLNLPTPKFIFSREKNYYDKVMSSPKETMEAMAVKEPPGKQPHQLTHPQAHSLQTALWSLLSTTCISRRDPNRDERRPTKQTESRSRAQKLNLCGKTFKKKKLNIPQGYERTMKQEQYGIKKEHLRTIKTLELEKTESTNLKFKLKDWKIKLHKLSPGQNYKEMKNKPEKNESQSKGSRNRKVCPHA